MCVVYPFSSTVRIHCPLQPICNERFFTDRIRRMGEGTVFSLSTGGEGVPTPRYLPPSQRTYPPPIEVLTSRGGTPSQVLMGGGGTQRYLPPAKVPTPPQPGPDRGRGYPKVPTPQDRTVDGVLDILRSVCLLRSRRRTFLFNIKLNAKENRNATSLNRPIFQRFLNASYQKKTKRDGD